MRSALLLPLILLAGCVATRPTAAFDPARVVDLSHAFGPDTIYWPTAQPFELRRVAYGRTPKGHWYVANNISMAEHGGTHMDAPVHFAEGRLTTADVPLSSCIGPAVVIDVSEQAARNPDYVLTPADVELFEKRHGRIPEGAIVCLRTGWGKFWPDKKRYLGTDKPMDVANLRFPGFSREAAELLLTRDIAAVAIDTASIDPGRSEDFIAHQTFNAANKPGFENVANLDQLPPIGATIIALPLKIQNGSGSPARVIAILP